MSLVSLVIIIISFSLCIVLVVNFSDEVVWTVGPNPSNELQIFLCPTLLLNCSDQLYSQSAVL